MKRKSDFIRVNIADEKLLVPVGTQVMVLNGLITLNNTADCAWELLAKERSLDELAAAFAERFDITLERASADVQTFVDEIARLGLLEP